VLMCRSRKAKSEFESLVHSKDWAYSSDEIERLGLRLDHARKMVKAAKRPWAKNYWTLVEQTLLRKWKQSVRLQEIGLRQVTKQSPQPPIDYDWWEGSGEVVMRLPIFDNIAQMLTDRFGYTTNNLDRAWEMARNESLQKARQGLG
jgi:hypothetical protein